MFCHYFLIIIYFFIAGKNPIKSYNVFRLILISGFGIKSEILNLDRISIDNKMAQIK